MTQNRMRRLEAEALQQPLFRLASPPLFPAFHGCAVQIVSVLAAEAVAPELCRVCQMVPERGRVLVRRADGAEFEVDWRDSVDDGTVEPDYRPATSGPNQSAAGSTDISRLLFLDSDSDGDGDGASAATDAQAAADAAKGLTEIWSLLQSCGVNSTQAILGESPSAKGRELSAARREAEAVALAEAEAHFRRLHTSSKVVVRLESSVAPVPDARIIGIFWCFSEKDLFFISLVLCAAVDDDVPVDMCIVGDCVKVSLMNIIWLKTNIGSVCSCRIQQHIQNHTSQYLYSLFGRREGVFKRIFAHSPFLFGENSLLISDVVIWIDLRSDDFIL